MSNAAPASHATVRVGTRGSTLALRQADSVVAALRQAHPELGIEVVVLRTPGDEDPDRDLVALGGPGVFVRTIQRALLDGAIDIAVHSCKDLPSAEPDGLVIGAYPPRADARDALVSRSGVGLADLPHQALIGTGSPRRRLLLHQERPDLRVLPLRGNVDTRLRRTVEGDLDGVVLAVAGLARLGRALDRAQVLDPRVFVPAIGQGILAVEARADDLQTCALLSVLDDPATRACATAERAVALQVGAGCATPIGAYASIESDMIHVDAFLASDHTGAAGVLVRAHASAQIADAAGVGARVGAALLDQAGTRATGAPR